MLTASLTLSADGRRRWGKSVRKMVPRSIHSVWLPRPDRPDPVDTIDRENSTRLSWLVPVRNARLARSPLAFFVGNPGIMAGDLSATLTSGLAAQICGDAHLANFGVFAAPDHSMVFDIGDFDETLPGPWEWDLKRLATSFAIAARHGGFDARERRLAAERPVAAYRRALAGFARMAYVDLWHTRLPWGNIGVSFPALAGRAQGKRKPGASGTDHLGDDLPAELGLVTGVDGAPRLVADPPMLVPLRELPVAERPADLVEDIDEVFQRYRATLAPSRRALLERYEPMETARILGGVRSLGIPRFVLLLIGRDPGDSLFLELKQASASVLEDELPGSEHANHGQRIVEGRRMMQAVDDPFLGWSIGRSGEHYVGRRLQTVKGAWDPTDASPKRLRRFAKLCGWALARAHARSGDALAIAGYLGSGNVFDRAVAEFADSYADQNERDYVAFRDAISAGRVPVAD
jgi:uncharacterized protein (DUF2252 family)